MLQCCMGKWNSALSSNICHFQFGVRHHTIGLKLYQGQWLQNVNEGSTKQGPKIQNCSIKRYWGSVPSSYPELVSGWGKMEWFLQFSAWHRPKYQMHLGKFFCIILLWHHFFSSLIYKSTLWIWLDCSGSKLICFLHAIWRESQLWPHNSRAL